MTSTVSAMGPSTNFYMSNDDAGGDTYNKIVEWLNQAALAADQTTKCDNLRKAQEIIIQSPSSSLLDNFLDEVLGFQNDRNAEIRKFIVGFIEEACKKDAEVLPKVVVNFNLLLQDSSAQVAKRVIQAAGTIYKLALVWICRAKTVTEEMEAVWKVLSQLKSVIISMVDNDNDGIRTLSVKFLESLVLLQTYQESESMQRPGDDFCLDDVPFTLKIARRRKLEQEANEVFDLLVKFHCSPHISAVNLMTCMGSLVLIAKLRPQFIGKVVSALETLHINLPPTLSKSQVSSVRKHLKLQLLNLLKLPASLDYHSNITTLLTDLGATYQEVNKAYPRPEEIRRYKSKRQAEEAANQESSKKARLMEDALAPGAAPPLDVEPEEEKLGSAVDITERFVTERLTPQLTAQLVMLFMSKLPSTMPPHFSASYTPIAAAGTEGQIRHVARLMATQLTSAGLGPGIKLSDTNTIPVIETEKEKEETSAQTVPPQVSEQRQPEEKAPVQTTLLPTGGKLHRLSRLKTLKLSEITKPLHEEGRRAMLEAAIDRILRAGQGAVEGGAGAARGKVITNMATTFNPNVRQAVLQYIAADPKSRLDLGISWLYEEHSLMQGFNRFPVCLKQDRKPDENYNSLLVGLLIETMRSKLDDEDRELLLTRLYLEVPVISEDAMEMLKEMCCDEARAHLGLKLLGQLVTWRPPRQMHFLNALLVSTSHENSVIRTSALSHVLTLYSRQDLSSIIEEYAIFYLGFLKLPLPPEVLFGLDRGRPVKTELWTEETVKVCLYLFMALLPVNHKMIHELAAVYVSTSAEVKRTILRLLEQPVRGMGMNSPELLALVEECPKGVETLVTRVIHVLTDKAPPSVELVSRVRDLYRSRVSDVRFLIPVLTGLTREEVVAALPKLIKLNPVVVKEVFNRLLSASHSPLGPAELLVALHQVEQAKCELKIVIKATSLCLAERHIYTQEVLAVVLQHLMELNPLPTLLMRTVIQSLSLYPRLIGFVINILQRLIVKQVWKQKKVWEGFIKCCQRTKPQSCQVLLQLPPPQLSQVFQECPDLRTAALDHVMQFTDHQRKHIPPPIMEIILGNQTVILDDEDSHSSENVMQERLLQPLLVVDIKQEPGEDPPPPGMELDLA